MAADDWREIIPVDDPAELAERAAGRLRRRIEANDGRIAICLAGGSSPKALYELLATDRWRGQIPWDRVHWFIGDERFVPPSDAQNNMAMARRAFLDRLAPLSSIHPIPTDAVTPDDAAARYEDELKSFYGAASLDPARPLFDLALMGIGSDGHTASLFPGDPQVEETRRWVIGVPKASLEPFVPRVSLTLPTLASCREMLFEVSGRSKRAILTRVLSGENLPAARARSIGKTVFMADRAALPENFRGA